MEQKRTEINGRSFTAGGLRIALLALAFLAIGAFADIGTEVAVGDIIRPGIDLDRGSVTAVFERLQRIGGSNPSFEIRTPTAVGGVRETSSFVKVESPNST